MYSRIIAGSLVASVMLPALAFAQTNDTQVQTLLSQIRALQEQLKTLLMSNVASSTKPMEFSAPGQVGKALCIRLARNLREGASGDDVRSLQEMLREDKESGFTSNATGFFGPLTARAMAKFQMRMNIASSSDGSVGPLTRGFFERRCGKGLDVKDDERAKVVGTITATSGSSITVKERDGQSRVVNITASTTIKVFSAATSTPSVGTMADLTVDKNVMAAGTTNSDGSLTAVHIEVGVPAAPFKIMRFDMRGKKMMDDE